MFKCIQVRLAANFKYIKIWQKLQNNEKSTLGESWIGLDKLHQLTSERSYSLKITMTDYDKKTFVAVYNNFKVSYSVFKCKSNSKLEIHYRCVEM